MYSSKWLSYNGSVSLYLSDNYYLAELLNFTNLSQWIVLEYRLPFYFRHCLLEEGSCCLKSKPCDCYLIAAVNKLNISSLLGIYNIQKWKEGEPLGALPLSIALKATSHLHLGHKASVTLGWTTIIEKVEPGMLGHESRTLGPGMLCVGHSFFSN